MIQIDATDMPYKALNEKIRELAAAGEEAIELDNVCGQKFIGDGLKGHVKIDINGIPGNDMAVFMDGPEITVHGNGQDGIGNTMNAGKVIIHGNAGDVIGYAMRGGKIFIKGDVGYRVGIHMKAYARIIYLSSSSAEAPATSSASTWPAASWSCSASTRTASSLGRLRGLRHAWRRDLYPR